jgi:hypothetical protein
MATEERKAIAEEKRIALEGQRIAKERERSMSVLSRSWTQATWMPRLGNIGSSLMQRSFKDLLVMELAKEY